MTSNEDQLRTAFGRDRVRAATKVVLGVGALVLVLALASMLPGVGRLLPESPVGVLAVAGALTALAVAALLVYLARGLAALVRVSLDGPREVVEHLASVVHWVVVLFAVLVVHAGLGAVVTPVLGGLTWLYDVALLLVALVPLTVVAARLYVSLDPAADLLADRLDSGSPELELSDPSSGGTDGS
jgi:hypothetical protein